MIDEIAGDDELGQEFGRSPARLECVNGIMMIRGTAFPLSHLLDALGEGLVSARGRPFSGGEIHLLRKRWGIPTVKINGKEANPRRWPDGTYSVQGAAEVLTVTPQTVFKWLQKGRLSGRQLAKGMPWQITLSSPQIAELRTQIRRTNQSKKEAS